MSIVAPWEARALTIIPPQPKRPIRLEGLSLQRGERGAPGSFASASPRTSPHAPPHPRGVRKKGCDLSSASASKNQETKFFAEIDCPETAEPEELVTRSSN